MMYRLSSVMTHDGKGIGGLTRGIPALRPPTIGSLSQSS